MAANTSPIFSKVGVINWGSAATANTALDGTGTVATIFTADATNGGRVERIRLVHLGTNIATVVRFFINNGSTNTSAANNSLFYETTMAANTLSQTAASVMQELAMALALPPGYKILMTVGTTIAAGIEATVIGGSY